MEGGSRRQPRRSRSPGGRGPYIWAALAASFLLILVTLLVPAIRGDPLGKVAGGLFMALFVATAIFAAVPPSRAIAVKLAASAASAGVFYLTLVPMINDVLFPRHLFGKIAYEGSIEGVGGVVVELPGGHRTTTDSTGRFTLMDVPPSVTAFEVHHRTLHLSIPVNSERLYAVIPRFAPVRTRAEAIAGDQWSPGSADRCRTYREGNRRTRAYVLDRALAPSRAEWSGREVTNVTLRMDLRPMAAATIAWAQMSQPAMAVQLDPGSSVNTYRWGIDNPESSVRIQVAVCVFSTGSSTPAPLEGTYWLEGSERLRGGTLP